MTSYYLNFHVNSYTTSHTCVQLY